jgi:hypothetical protein
MPCINARFPSVRREPSGHSSSRRRLRQYYPDLTNLYCEILATPRALRTHWAGRRAVLKRPVEALVCAQSWLPSSGGQPDGPYSSMRLWEDIRICEEDVRVTPVRRVGLSARDHHPNRAVPQPLVIGDLKLFEPITIFLPVTLSDREER